MVTTPRAEENALTASALDGDEQALGRLLAIHQQATYNVAYRVLGSEADARDAVQEAYLLAVRAIRGDGAPPRDVDRFRGWLRRVVTNAALGQLRRRPSFSPMSVDDVAEALPAPERVEPARQAERREARGDILRALLSLPDAQRAALTLRDSEGFSYDEIAAILSISRGAVETLLFRARRNFRAAYEGLAATSEPVGCAELAQLLSVGLDDELSAIAWQDLQAHLQDCSRCRREIDGLRRSRRLYALAPLLTLPAGWDPIGAALGTAGAGLTGAVATASQASHGAADAGAGMGASAGGSAAPTGLAGAGTLGNATGAASTAGGASATQAGVGAGLVTKLAGLSAAKAAAVLAAAGIGVATIATPLMTNEPVPPGTAAPVAATVAAAPVASPTVAPLAPASGPSATASPAAGTAVPSVTPSLSPPLASPPAATGSPTPRP